jgi:TusA-related sulfurtransferase
MIETMPEPVAMRVIDSRGSYVSEPLAELIAAVREGWIGETIAVRTTDRNDVTLIVKWVAAAGHGLLGMYEHHGYDEVLVEIRR